MAEDTSKAKTVGVNVALDKTFEKGLKVGDKNYFQGINVGFEGFVGQTEEKGEYNVNPPTTKDISKAYPNPIEESNSLKYIEDNKGNTRSIP